jgi:hypothetical protein
MMPESNAEYFPFFYVVKSQRDDMIVVFEKL